MDITGIRMFFVTQTYKKSKKARLELSNKKDLVIENKNS